MLAVGGGGYMALSDQFDMDGVDHSLSHWVSLVFDPAKTLLNFSHNFNLLSFAQQRSFNFDMNQKN